MQRVGGVGIKVAPRGVTTADTAAQYQLDDPAQVCQFLESLLGSAAAVG